MSSRAAIAAIAAAGLCLVSAAQATNETKSDSDTNKTSSTPSAKDKMFVEHAAKGGMKEVQMGEKQAKSDDVKKIAEKIESDHKAANEELKDLAEKKGVTPADWGQDVEEDGEDERRQLRQEYLMAMKAEHEKDIAAFEKEANDSGRAEMPTSKRGQRRRFRRSKRISR